MTTTSRLFHRWPSHVCVVAAQLSLRDRVSGRNAMEAGLRVGPNRLQAVPALT